MTTTAFQTTTIQFDDLAIDYAVGKVVEAFSIVELRGFLPTGMGDALHSIEVALVFAPSLPPHVSEAINRTCRNYGFTVHMIVGAIRHLQSDGQTGPGCTVRTISEFLIEWRRVLRNLRPVPKFGARVA